MCGWVELANPFAKTPKASFLLHGHIMESLGSERLAGLIELAGWVGSRVRVTMGVTRGTPRIILPAAVTGCVADGTLAFGAE